MDTTGTVADNVSITFAVNNLGGGFTFLNNGSPNWPGLSTNGGSAPAEFVNDVTFDFGGFVGDGPTNFTFSLAGLDPLFLYRVTAVTQVFGGDLNASDIITVAGTNTVSSSITRGTSAAGAFHDFNNVATDASGNLSLILTSTNNNPIINGFLVQATSVPEPSAALLGGLGLLALLRRRR